MTEPISIGFVLPHLDVGGIERLVVNLATALDRRRFRPILVLRTRRGSLLTRVPSDVPIIDLAGAPSRFPLLHLQHALSTAKVEVAYVGTNAMNLWVLASVRTMRKKVPIIISEHTPLGLYLREAKWRPLRLYAMRTLYRHAAAVAVPTADIGSELKRVLALPDLNVIVLNNPVISPRPLHNHSDDDPPAALRGLSGPIVVSAGRLVYAKGFDILIRTFADFLRARPECHLVILGEGPQRAALEHLTAELNLAGHVHLLGQVDDPSAYFRHAAVFVSSSRREGFPNVLVEALAAGVPVVAVDCPVGPSNVLDGGGAGLLVKPGDRDALIEAMGRILTEPELCSRLRTKGFARARDFEVSVAAQAFERLFLSLASHGRKSDHHC